MIDGFVHHRGYFDAEAQADLLRDLREVIASAPYFTPSMPKSGKPLSVRMTNAGKLGWLTDKKDGYRYQVTHPDTGEPWPPIPNRLLELWAQLLPDAAPPEACLINWYGPAAKLGMHRDADEVDQETPVLSVSLGDDAWFRVGGLKRGDPSERVLLRSGDVAILGGLSRRAYHGIDRILPDTSDLFAEPGRMNLTLRRVTIPS